MFLFDKKPKKEASFINAKTIDMLKNVGIALALVGGLKAAAYIFLKKN